MIDPFWVTEKRAIERALWATKGNIEKAADGMGLGAATVYRKVKQYQIDVKRIREECLECRCGEILPGNYHIVLCRRCSAEKGHPPLALR